MKPLKVISILFLGLGALLLLVGLFFYLMKWPDIFKGMISGPILLIIGLIIFLFNRIQTKNK